MADVTVIGAGVFGLSIAWRCLSRGATVRVIEKRHVGAGSSGGIVGALAPHVPENWNEKKAFQLDSLLMAQDFWAEVDAASGLSSGYARLGRLQPIADDKAHALAETRKTGAKELWQGRAQWQVIPASQAGDWAPSSPSGHLIHDTLSARINPRAACDSLAKAIIAKGGVIAQGDGTAATGTTVWATGYEGLLELSANHTRSVGNGVKGQAVLLRHDAKDQPQLFADGLHIIPHADGTVAIGSTTEREFDTPSATDNGCDDLLIRARTAFPVLGDAPEILRWAGVRPRARTRAPMLGAYPDKPGHFIANGGFKIGFGMAPKIADVMADLMLDGRDHIPADFRVEANY